MKRIFLGLWLCLATSAVATAQGDACADAAVLTDVTDYCSADGEFSLTGATRGTVADDCGPGNRSLDVWFRFVAQSAGVSIKIDGNARSTLQGAQFAVYGGDCGALRQIGCGINRGNSGLTTFTGGGLTPGSPYFIRVFAQGATDTGSFSLCVRSFVPGPPPTSDCNVARVLCGKPAGFSVASLLDAGANRNELDPNGCLPVESQSVWYSFTAANAGVLVFDLTPDEPTGDLDFILYELSGAPGNCANKRAIRCMASGDRGCQGATGLRLGERDLEEGSGCGGGNNNYVRELTMVPGRSYSLVVNNYDTDNPGFTIDFGNSTAVFTGPTADFTVSDFYTGCDILLEDSTLLMFEAVDSPGASYAWDFGPGATPRKAEGRQANATFAGPDFPKFVTLTVTDECSVTITKRIEPTATDGLPKSFDLTAPTCENPDGGAVRFTVGPSGDFFFTGVSQGSTSGEYTGLTAGTYLFTISHLSNVNCVDEIAIEIPAPDGISSPAILVDSDTEACAQDAFTFRVGSPDTATTYRWTFGADGVPATATGPGPHVVTYTGAAGPKTIAVEASSGECAGAAQTEISFAPAIDLDFATDITQVSCTSDSSGAILVTPTPAGQYVYTLNARAEQTSNLITNVVRGVHSVRVRPVGSAPSCGVVREVTVGDDGTAAPFFGAVTTAEASCAAVADGRLALDLPPNTTLSVNGGAPGGVATFDTLLAGLYRLRLTDAGGCSRDTAVVVGAGPGPTLDLGPDQRARFGDTVLILPQFTEGRALIDSFRYGGLDSTPTLLATLGGLRFVPNRSPQIVTLTLVDEAGCAVTDEVVVEVRVQEFFQAPSAFSPNQDDINDRFYLRAGSQVARIQQLSVYDRWGGLLFNLNDFPPNEPDFGWDGTVEGVRMDTGVYVYLARVVFVNGTVKDFAGEVSLIR